MTLVELHTHPRRGKHGLDMAVRMLTQAAYRQIHVLCFTDHHEVWTPDELAEVSRLAGDPPVVLLSGQEVSTAEGMDVLVFGWPDAIKRGTPMDRLQELFGGVPGCGIPMVWAHPFRQGMKSWDKNAEANFRKFDAIEIINGNKRHTDADATMGYNDWRIYRFPATAGTDSHRWRSVGTHPTAFLHPIRNILELCEELRAGRCLPAAYLEGEPCDLS